jgi:hypothetical protein
MYQQMLQQSSLESEKKTVVGKLMEVYLNYTPYELDLKNQNRMVVDEALIKGAGVWFTELYQPPGSDRVIPGSFHENFNNVVWDPDADKFDDILWIARRRCHSRDLVAAKFQLDPEKIKPNAESYEARSGRKKVGYENDRRNGRTNDLVTYWEIYSKTGFGDRLKDADAKIRGQFDALGPYCYIVVADGVDHPLNIKKEMLAEPPGPNGLPESLVGNTSWPIPFWKEVNGWPCTLLAWHGKPEYSYPIAPIKPAIGELRFINWAMSFMATKIAISNQTIVAVAKAAEKSLKDQLLEVEDNGFKIVEISESIGKDLKEIISIFNMPGVTSDMWNIIKSVAEVFDRRMALTELAYGMSKSAFRSAAEASVKSEQISVRPDDMADILENALSMNARREAFLAGMAVEGSDVAPIMGPMAAQAWDMHVKNTDPDMLLREYDFRIEAGSARKPNPGAKVEQMNAAMQILMPIAQGMMQAGDPKLLNTLLKDWGRVMDIDIRAYQLSPPPPPPPPPGPGGGQPPPGPPPGGGPPPPEGPPQ